VLVTVAGGGVGSLLVQLAGAAGARQVVAAASSDRKLTLAEELGADVTVDYTRAGWTDQVRAATGGVDLALDGVGGQLGRAALELVAPGGRFLSYGGQRRLRRPRRHRRNGRSR
jgi:NADPH:quinone reductase